MEGAFRLFKSTREYLTPVLTESQFLERGMVTPEEFVRAGDQLVRSSPSWTWESGEENSRRPYLPPNKQFLMTRSVPSLQRVSTMQASTVYNESAEENEGGAGEAWCLSDFSKQKAENLDADIDFVDASDLGTSSAAADTTQAAKPPAVPSDEYLDMEDTSLGLDSATILKPDVSSSVATVKVRRYDVSITYDNYYRTPRVWLHGYNEDGSPLEPERIFEDVMQDYAKRTVTIDPHPHLSRSEASIHPCRHGPAMLNILNALKESGNTPSVDQYLFIFLKFIQSVIPTIEYDYTIDVQAT
jgi:ubiquitin-like-conjugating enzyme ATG3